MARGQWWTASLSVVVLAAATTAGAMGDPPPDWVPTVRLSYLDPSSGDRVECADPCRRFEIPVGTVLTVRVTVANRGGEPRSDGPVWDLWWDQRLHPFPGIEGAACIDADGSLDRACWQDLVDRVEWPSWEALPADLSCVPEEPAGCVDVTLDVPVSADFDGSRGRGVYSLALWVDRYRALVETDEFNNYAGPMRVVVRADDGTAPGAEAWAEAALPAHIGGGKLVAGTAGRSFDLAVVDENLDQGFALSSPRAEASLEFAPGHPGAVTVEVDQIGTWEKMVVEVRKISTGEVLSEARGMGRLRLEGRVTAGQLKDDRRFAVVVRPEEGTRGVRGTIRATFPARVRLIAPQTPDPAAAADPAVSD